MGHPRHQLPEQGRSLDYYVRLYHEGLDVGSVNNLGESEVANGPPLAVAPDLNKFQSGITKAKLEPFNAWFYFGPLKGGVSGGYEAFIVVILILLLFAWYLLDK